MIQQILKTKRGKWAAVLVVVAVLCAIGAITAGEMEGISGVVPLIAIAVVLALSASKETKNPPAPPSLQSMGIHVGQEALDEFAASGTLPNVEDCPVILAQDEVAVYACRAERIETKNRRIETTGSGGGATIRVAKGVSIRTGGAGSKSIYGDVEMVHGGEFVVTTKRVVFVANNRAFEEKLSNISAVSVDDGCLAIMTAKSSYTLRMPSPDYPCNIIKHCIKTMQK